MGFKNDDPNEKRSMTTEIRGRTKRSKSRKANKCTMQLPAPAVPSPLMTVKKPPGQEAEAT